MVEESRSIRSYYQGLADQGKWGELTRERDEVRLALTKFNQMRNAMDDVKWVNRISEMMSLNIVLLDSLNTLFDRAGLGPTRSNAAPMPGPTDPSPDFMERSSSLAATPGMLQDPELAAAPRGREHAA